MRFTIIYALALLPGLALADASTPASDGICQIAFGDPIDVRCLPAISGDGATVAVAEVDPDGGRGYPNLALLLFPVAGGKPKRIALLSTSEVDRAGGEVTGPLREAVDKRIAEANARLAAGKFAALPRLPLDEVPDAEKQALRGPGFSIRIDRGPLEVVTPDGKRRSVKVRMPKVPAKCREVNHPILGGAWGDARVIVVEVPQHGNDTCWEGTPAWAIVKQ